MFKEKYLIFEEGEPHSGLSENRGEEPNKEPEKREVYAQDIAEDLLSEKSAEKVEEIMRQLYKLFTNRDIPIFEKFSQEGQKVAAIVEIFFGERTRTFLTERIKAGYEFGGYGYGGAMLYWWKPEESSTSIEVNPLFLEPEIFSLLSPKMKESVKKCQMEVLQNEINIEFVKIFNVLLEKNVALRTFDLQRFGDSDFGNDVFAVLEAGKKVPDGQGYEWSVTGKGVSFIALDFLKAKNWKDIHLELKDYDQNLNLKALPPTPKSPKVVDLQHEQETGYEKPPEGNPPYLPTDGELRIHKEKIEGYKRRMREIVSNLQDKDLTAFNEKIEKLIDESGNLISTTANNGISSTHVFSTVMGQLDLPSWKFDMPEDKQDDPKYEEYKNLHIEALKAPWDLYYPKND